MLHTVSNVFFATCLPNMIYIWLTFPKGVRVTNKARIRDSSESSQRNTSARNQTVSQHFKPVIPKPGGISQIIWSFKIKHKYQIVGKLKSTTKDNLAISFSGHTDTRSRVTNHLQFMFSGKQAFLY